MPGYFVRLQTDSGHCWQTYVSVRPRQELTYRQLERRARRRAARAFGRQARSWELFDGEWVR